MLISIVMFIRSKPRLPGVRENQGPRAVADAPITVMARTGDQITVALRTSEATGRRVMLPRSGGEWVITHFEGWIV